MNTSVIIIFDKFREEKINRLLNSIKPQLKSLDCEILLVQESNAPLTLPKLPIKVRHLTVPEKQGIPFNRNQGIKNARGETIIFIDDDCWVQEKWLEALLQPLENNPELLAVTSGTKIPPSNLLGNCISALGFPGGGSLGFEKVWKVSPEGFTNHIAAGNCALRKKLFDKIGFFDEAMKYGAEDAEFSFRLEQAGIPVKYAAEAYAFHEARTTWNSFLHWQLRRGKANYHFQKKVSKVRPFLRLRVWSAANVVKYNFSRARFPVVAALLMASFILQQAGYAAEAFRSWRHNFIKSDARER